MSSSERKSYKAQELFEIVVDTVVGIQTSDGFGSGVIIDSNGIIATNHHVITDFQNVSVSFNNNTQIDGLVVRSYRDVDLAFVRVKFERVTSFPSSLMFSSKGKELFCNRSLKVGETVFAIGHPLGLEFTLTQGIVSSVERTIKGAKYLQIDASINPGNSGGPLYSTYAELIGINTMKLSGTQGLNFAIPASIIAERYKEFLIEQTKGLVNYCNVCGNNSKSDKYCECCGSSLRSAATKKESTPKTERGNLENIKNDVCNSCGSIVDSSKYCSACGSKLF